MDQDQDQACQHQPEQTDTARQSETETIRRSNNTGTITQQELASASLFRSHLRLNNGRAAAFEHSIAWMPRARGQESVEEVFRVLTVGLAHRIKDAREAEEVEPLIILAETITTRDVINNENILDACIEFENQAAWRNPTLLTKAFITFDAANGKKLSKQILSGAIARWARLEADRLRALYAYLARLAGRTEFSRSFAITRLKKKYVEYHGKPTKQQRSDPEGDQGLASEAMRTIMVPLPEYPASEGEDGPASEAMVPLPEYPASEESSAET